MNKTYKVTIVQYYDFYVEAPNRETADHIAREHVTWEDHFSEAVIRLEKTDAATIEPAATWEGEQ